jgi:predicted nucleic-acid-binding protein
MVKIVDCNGREVVVGDYIKSKNPLIECIWQLKTIGAEQYCTVSIDFLSLQDNIVRQHSYWVDHQDSRRGTVTLMLSTKMTFNDVFVHMLEE